MKYKIKKYICILLTTILFFIMPVNKYYTIQSYAAEDVAMSPLYVPISALVTAAAIGSGIIAKNSQEAIEGANQLVQNVITNLKTREIEKSDSDPNYVSPFTVIKGGKPEKPSNDNKNDKWVALGAGALASNEIWTNRKAVEAIMSEINNLKGYDKTINSGGIKNVSDTNLIATSSASGIALQLAQYDSKLNTQFTAVINSDVFNNKISQYGMNKDDLVYAVTFLPTHLASKTEKYPMMAISCIDSSQFTKVRTMYDLGFNTKTGKETSSQFAYSYSYYYLTEKSGNDSMCVYRVLNDDDASVKIRSLQFTIYERDSTDNPSVNYLNQYHRDNIFYARNPNINNLVDIAYVGFKWASENPWTFTNNVYNSNQTLNVNFPDWLQQSINLLGQQLEGLRLGLTTIQPSWDPNQEQIQTGLSPTNVINQYINNYENPENIPDDPQPNPDPDPGPTPEPVPDNEYLGSFLLPESITTKFPFCIPFDVVRCLRFFSTSDREAPRWQFDLKYGDQISHIVIDLSIFDDLASFIRPLEYILFLVGLAVGTRSLIRG